MASVAKEGANGHKPGQHQPAERIVFRSSESAAAFLDVHPKTLRLWQARGCPGMQPRRYDVQQIVRWLIRERAIVVGTTSQPIDDDAAMLAAGTSPALERYREARARIAEVQACEAEGTYVNAAKMQNGLQRMAAILRDAGDKLQKQCGPNAKLILDERLDAFEALIPELFGTDA
jgi:phage terminase Nu1 subunit (DNA packaging protein)